MDIDTYRYSYAAWIEAFTIFAKYSEGDDHIAAEHDIIYACDKEVSQEDKERLEVLGWYWDEELPCFYKHV